jgi:hypothetical protein
MTQETKRYQNISTIMTAVLRDGKNITMKPGQIIALTEKDVQDTKDSHADYEKNPFDLGLISDIHEGKDQHPKAPKRGRTMRADDARKVVDDMTIEEAEVAIKDVTDMAGIVVLQTMLGESTLTTQTDRHDRIGELIDEQARSISDANLKNSALYSAMTN